MVEHDTDRQGSKISSMPGEAAHIVSRPGVTPHLSMNPQYENIVNKVTWWICMIYCVNSLHDCLIHRCCKVVLLARFKLCVKVLFLSLGSWPSHHSGLSTASGWGIPNAAIASGAFRESRWIASMPGRTPESSTRNWMTVNNPRRTGVSGQSD